jgi:tetratricopeptide (TPR) repeat protein
MRPSQDDDIARLLKRGLNYYGLGEVESAIACWEKARALDPENPAVRDYLETAYEELSDAKDEDDSTQASLSLTAGDDAEDQLDEDSTPRSLDLVETGESESTPDTEERIAEALQAFEAGELETAWDMLQEIGRQQPSRLDVQGYLGLVRAQRAKRFVAQIGDLARQLRPKCEMEELTSLNLKPDEGFLLSQIDGTLSVEELISLSTIGRVETLGILAKFVSEGIVE